MIDYEGNRIFLLTFSYKIVSHIECMSRNKCDRFCLENEHLQTNNVFINGVNLSYKNKEYNKQKVEFISKH